MELKVGDYVMSESKKNIVLVTNIREHSIVGKLVYTSYTQDDFYTSRLNKECSWSHPNDHNWIILKGYNSPLWKVLNND